MGWTTANGQGGITSKLEPVDYKQTPGPHGPTATGMSHTLLTHFADKHLGLLVLCGRCTDAFNQCMGFEEQQKFLGHPHAGGFHVDVRYVFDKAGGLHRLVKEDSRLAEVARESNAARVAVQSANTKLDEAQAALDEGLIKDHDGMPGKTWNGKTTFKEAQTAVHAANRRSDELELAVTKAQAASAKARAASQKARRYFKPFENGTKAECDMELFW